MNKLLISKFLFVIIVLGLFCEKNTNQKHFTTKSKPQSEKMDIKIEKPLIKDSAFQIQKGNQGIDISKSQFSDKKVIAFANCIETEINSDMVYSVSNSKEYLNKNNINIEILVKGKKCGILLINNCDSAFVQGSITDIELIEKCIKYFNIKTE